jgi:hypothetical protein
MQEASHSTGASSWLSRPVPPLGSGDGYVWAGVNL